MGDLGKAEMLKTETLKGRMLRWTQKSARSGSILICFHSPQADARPAGSVKNFFLQRIFGG
jgi:hypothetical protein